VPTPPSLADVEALTDRLTVLEAQLASRQTPELERLRATARRERALIADHDELAERHGLQQAIAGANVSWPDCAPCAPRLSERSARSTRCSPSAPACTRRSPPPATTARRSATT
jgi:hypothetical protein